MNTERTCVHFQNLDEGGEAEHYMRIVGRPRLKMGTDCHS